DHVVVRQDDELFAAHVQRVVPGVLLAVHVGVAVHDDALAAVFHEGRVRRTDRDGVGFLLADRARAGDVVGVVVGKGLGVLALEAVDRLAGGVGAQHDEIARPGVHFVGQPPRRIDGNGALGVVGGPPRAGHQGDEQRQGDEGGKTFFHAGRRSSYWMAPGPSSPGAIMKAPSRPCAASSRSQHSRTAPRPPGCEATQWAAWAMYPGALTTLAAKPARCMAGRSMMSSPIDRKSVV